MNKSEFAHRVWENMRDNGIKKSIPGMRNTFHITDAYGSSADFTVKQKERHLQYTVEDVERMLDACIAESENCLKLGEQISFRGFGTLGLQYREARRAKHPETDEWCEIPGHYVPKFVAGNTLKVAARVYDAALREYDAIPDDPEPIYDEDDQWRIWK